MDACVDEVSDIQGQDLFDSSAAHYLAECKSKGFYPYFSQFCKETGNAESIQNLERFEWIAGIYGYDYE